MKTSYVRNYGGVTRDRDALAASATYIRQTMYVENRASQASRRDVGERVVLASLRRRLEPVAETSKLGELPRETIYFDPKPGTSRDPDPIHVRSRSHDKADTTEVTSPLEACTKKHGIYAIFN
ncbi:hypothetical protein FQR65_LT19518 [Abscondita terminalis]|nr:hypothetical protein FQR65_LT19518 [Abscondita terminalis]